MSAAGLSKPRLARMHRVLSGYLEREELPGLVALVSHHDDAHVETLGTMAFGHPAPKPEHLAAMKALAMKNDPGRTSRRVDSELA
jgi:hypothetical protein